MALIRSNSGAFLFCLLPLAACQEAPDAAPTDDSTLPGPTSTAPASTTGGGSSSLPTTTAPVTPPTTSAPGTTSAPTSTSGEPATTNPSETGGTTTSSTSTTSSTTSPNTSTSETLGPTTETPTSAPATEPGPADACASALLCDTFDDAQAGMAPGAPWKTEGSGGSVSVSNERAFSGDKSVHVSNEPGDYKRAYFSLDGSPVFPGAGQELYGRLMMWLDTSPADGVHWTFIQGEGPSDDNSYDIFYRYGGQHQGKLMANFETQGVASDCWNHSQTVMPTKTWTCLEWRFNVATDEMQFWLDGAELEDLHVVGQGNAGSGCVASGWSNGWPAPKQFETLRLGLEKYQTDAELNLWIDDVAVAASRVGCPAEQ